MGVCVCLARWMDCFFSFFRKNFILYISNFFSLLTNAKKEIMDKNKSVFIKCLYIYKDPKKKVNLLFFLDLYICIQRRIFFFLKKKMKDSEEKDNIAMNYFMEELKVCIRKELMKRDEKIIKDALWNDYTIKKFLSPPIEFVTNEWIMNHLWMENAGFFQFLKICRDGTLNSRFLGLESIQKELVNLYDLYSFSKFIRFEILTSNFTSPMLLNITLDSIAKRVTELICTEIEQFQRSRYKMFENTESIPIYVDLFVKIESKKDDSRTEYKLCVRLSEFVLALDGTNLLLIHPPCYLRNEEDTNEKNKIKIE